MAAQWLAEPSAVANGRFRLVRVIGRGGMATVWRGYDQLLDRDVAIKVVEHDTADASALLAEAKAAAGLRHPSITEVYDAGIERSTGGRTTSYVVMELVDGETLLTLIGPGRPLPARYATGVVAHIASALATAHAAGIVHRDISPANVMATRHGVKVLDFGIATTKGSAQRNQAGLVHANPRYVAPERLDEPDRPVGPACDVYSLGVLWYRLLTGRLPWTAAGRDELIEAHVNWAPEPLPDTVELPARLRELCLRCLGKHPSRRPTAADVADALKDYRDLDAAPAPGPPPGPEPVTVVAEGAHRRRLGVAAFLVALVVVAVLGLWAAATDRDGSAGSGPTATASVPGPPATSGPGGAASSTMTAGGSGPVGAPGASGDPGRSGGSAGDGSPSPTGPASTTNGATSASVQITGIGGVVLVLCVNGGDDATVILATPALLYIIGDHDYGPAQQIHVTFDSATHTTTIEATCSAGAVLPQVNEG